MGVISILQSSSVYIIILIFIFITGKLLYDKYVEQRIINKAKMKKLLKNIEKED